MFSHPSEILPSGVASSSLRVAPGLSLRGNICHRGLNRRRASLCPSPTLCPGQVFVSPACAIQSFRIFRILSSLLLIGGFTVDLLPDLRIKAIKSQGYAQLLRSAVEPPFRVHFLPELGPCTLNFPALILSPSVFHSYLQGLFLTLGQVTLGFLIYVFLFSAF